jgi:uncharacterized protein YrrD
MQHLRRVVGRTVISIETGNRLGSISDVLLDDGTLRVVGFVVGGGLLSQEQVLPFGEVKALAGDTVLAMPGATLVGAREWREQGAATVRISALAGRPLITAAGQRLGAVTDLLVDEQTAVVDALEVATSDLGGLRTRRSIVAATGARIGPHAVVVPDEAAARAETAETTDETAAGDR